MLKDKNKMKGFTLVELLISIAIIGLLSTFVVNAYGGSRDKAKDVRRVTDLKAISKALEIYYSDNSKYPFYESGGVTCPMGVASYNMAWLDCWNDLESELSPYIKSLPKDPSKDKYYFYKGVDGGEGYILAMFPAGDPVGDMGCWLGSYCIGNNWK